jgi:hypothetical protein
MNYETLVLEIQKASEEGVTMEHAERVAATSLFVMNALSERLTLLDKERRMRKRGLKAIKSAVRTEEVKRHDKKPTESQLEDVINLSPIVASEEEAFDNSDINADELERQFGIAKESHLFFRSVSKGTFNG